jgi:hypothetical protein
MDDQISPERAKYLTNKWKVLLDQTNTKSKLDYPLLEGVETYCIEKKVNKSTDNIK